MKRPAFLKSALALLLCLTMVLSFVPMQAAAAVEPVAVHDCARDGHEYKAGTFRATCQQHPFTRYTCSYCGDSYDVYAEELYSDWQETKPDVDEALIQTKTQYRTSQYDEVTSYNTELDGYDRIGSQWSKIDTRTVAYVSSWPSGFDTTNSLYTQYNKAVMKATASESATRKTVIDSDKVVGYLYYHWCYADSYYSVASKSGNYTTFHAYYDTTAPSSYVCDPSDMSYNTGDDCCDNSSWFFVAEVYEQTYTNYRMEYIFGAWSNYSDWSDTEATASETQKVATRTVYRYVNAPFADHSYNTVTTAPTCSAAGKTVYTCSVCDYSYTEELPATGHIFDNGKCTGCGTAEPSYYLVGWINGADYGCNDDYENMGEYKFVDGKLVATFEQDSYVFIKSEGNAAWYMTKEYAADDTATFYNTTTGAGEKMFVPGGVEITFTLADGEGDTLVLSRVGGGCTHKYDRTVTTLPTCNEGGMAAYTCSKCGDSYTEELAATGHDFRRGVCKNCGLVDETYVTPNYYLVGYINGVDYGSVEDYENRGEFRFEEGKLVINCTQDSYVFVKTEGNTAWYMTNEYCTDTSATLYDTRDGAYEKMFIPAYMEVTFTLVETENNTLSLSYEAVPCKHIYDDTVSVEATCTDDGIMLRTCRICTATAEKPIPATGHSYEPAVTEPDCTTPGYTTYTCSVCGHSYKADAVEANGHDYESKVAQAPGCFDEGVMIYTCKVCGHSYSGIIEATGHKYEGVVTLAATCTTDGYTTYTCSGCGDAYIEAVKSPGHSYKAVVTKATCTEKGYTTYNCATCNHTYVDNYVNATGHKLVNGKCSVCGDSDSSAYYLFGWINGANYACEDDWENLGQYRFVNGKLVTSFTTDSYVGIKTGDNANWYMTKAYTEESTAKFYKTDANEKMLLPGGVELTLTLTVNDDGSLTLSYSKGETAICKHSYHVELTTKPGCETGGVKTYTCNDCGVTYTENLDAVGHSYKAVVTKPTCTTGGITKYTCLICGDSYTDKIVPAAGHTILSQITTKPTCETAGVTTHSCQKCDYSYATKVEATGHSYEAEVTAPTCTEKGYTTHTCSACGDTYQDKEVAATGHQYTAEETQKPTCTVAGIMTYTCASCGDSYTEDIATVAHNYVEGFCTACGKSQVCEHSWVDGVCEHCGVACVHDYVYGICTKCADVDPFYVPAYYLVGYINGADYGCNDDWENMGDYKFEDDKLTVTFEQDSYVFLKTEGNANWYMTEQFVNDSTATFCNTSTGANEKMFVPGNVELVFTLTAHGDDTVTLTYKTTACDHSYEVTGATPATCTADGSVSYTCIECGNSYTETVPATGHSFVDGSCNLCGAADPDFEPEYYLVGFINGANYGCEDDHANMGEYKFVDGKLTAKFEQDSYVFLKTTGNANWYMAQAYSDGTTAIFYNTTTGAEEKLFVPAGVEITFTLTVNSNDTLTLSYTTAVSVKPTLTLKSPTLEFKDMVKVVAFYTAENTQDVVEMGMITYKEKVDDVDINTAEYVIPGATYEQSSNRYFSSSQGINAKYLADTLYLACYAKLADGTYVYTKLAPYSPITYANNQLKNSTNAQLKQLVVAMLNYGAAAQNYFGYNTSNLANASLTAEQIALPEGYTSDMVQSVPAAEAAKQGSFANNKGFSVRKPAVSFEGAFSINYFFTPAHTPADGVTLYYWTEADFNAADVLTAENATGAIGMTAETSGQYRGDIEGIAAKNIANAVYVAAVYSDDTTTWTSGVLGYSIGAYCASMAKGTDTMADLAKATAVYGYHAKQYFG